MAKLTFAICALCILLTIVAIITFESKLSKLFKGLDKSNASLPFSGSDKLSGLMKDYEKTFKTPSYTTEYAGDYISTDTVSACFGINLKLVATIPNLLTSLGILGTFIGLTILFPFLWTGESPS